MRFKIIEKNNQYIIKDELKVLEDIIFNNWKLSKQVYDALNKLSKKIEFQSRVIDKCIRFDNHKKYEIETLKEEKSTLEQEKIILKKIIHEETNIGE